MAQDYYNVQSITEYFQRQEQIKTKKDFKSSKKQYGKGLKIHKKSVK